MRTTTRQDERRARLAALAEQCIEVYDADTRAALDGEQPVPRYALMACEGSPESTYRDNPDLVARNSRAELARVAESSLDEGWGILAMYDLDTGDELGWTIRVRID